MKPVMEARVLAGRYELGVRMGSGGMGTVWRARDRTLGRDVAVKLLHEGLAADTTFAQRFRQEALSAAKLTHPNVVAVFDAGEHDGVPFIVMELVEGPSLHGILAKNGALPVAEVARIGRAVCGALAHAHGRGLIHRDMKPANVLLEEASREPKVADFGIAKGLEDSAGLTRTGGLIGTAAYLSPEQVSGRPATPASDVYAVGCMLYASLVGEPPFGGTTPVAVAMRHLNDPVPNLRERRPDVPEAFASVVHRALEKDPARRFADAQEMQRAISDTGLGGGPPADLDVAATVPVVGTGPLPARASTERIGARAARGHGSPRAVRVLAVLSALLIAAAAVALAATYFRNRQPDTRAQIPTAAPTLEPSTPAPTPQPSPSPAVTESAGEPGNPFGNLPVIGGDGPGRSRNQDRGNGNQAD
ncbi:MAG: protein kinase domain-containing protein [Actinomycetota bacterium]